jgi:hypothetical protein
LAVKVRLSDGITIIVDAGLEDFRERCQAALADNTVLEVTNGDGKTRVVNPLQILYFEEAEAEDAVLPEANSSTRVTASPPLKPSR